MELDKKEHQEFLLVLINQSQIPGKFLELACEVKEQVKNAAIKNMQAQNESNGTRTAEV